MKNINFAMLLQVSSLLSAVEENGACRQAVAQSSSYKKWKCKSFGSSMAKGIKSDDQETTKKYYTEIASYTLNLTLCHKYDQQPLQLHPYLRSECHMRVHFSFSVFVLRYRKGLSFKSSQRWDIIFSSLAAIPSSLPLPPTYMYEM